MPMKKRYGISGFAYFSSVALLMDIPMARSRSSFNSAFEAMYLFGF